jgi:putative CocE/NonD family hydrolase
VGALLVLAGIGSAAGIARVSAAGTSDPVTTFTKTADVRIAMRDGVSLDSDEYVPDGGCPCPVIVVQTPYRKSDATVGEYNPYFPSHGYAEIVVDVRGTGSSGGYWTSFGVPEQLDSVEIVNWAAHRPFSNGVIGLAGVSYSAINQFLTVEQPGTSAVKAIFPIVPMGDAYRDVVFAGGDTDTGFIPLWLGLVNGLNALPADDAQSQPKIALNVESQHLEDIAQFAAPAVADATLGSYESLLPRDQQSFPDQAYDGRYYRTVSPLSKVDQVKVPTFIVGGEYDLFQRGEPLLYRGLNLPAAQKKLVFGPWYHGNPSANLTADDGSGPVYDTHGTLMQSTNNLSLAWFDHWLKGVNNGIDAFPTVETWQIGANQWQPALSFPSLATHYHSWYLSSGASGSSPTSLYDGSLSVTGGPGGNATLPWQPLTGACSRSTAQWTAGLGAVGNCPNDDTSSQALGLTFTSQPFLAPYVVEGPLMADLWISSNRPDTTLVATVDVVHSDNSVFRVTAGSLVASLRAVDATPCAARVMDCTVYADGLPVIPWHPYTRASQSPLVPGRPTEVKVEIFPTSLVLEPTDRLRFAITTGDLPHQGPNLSTLAGSAGGVTSLYFDPGHPSRLLVGADNLLSQGTPPIILRGGQPSMQPHIGGPVAPRAGAAAPAVARAVPIALRQVRLDGQRLGAMPAVAGGVLLLLALAAAVAGALKAGVRGGL